MNTTKMNWNDQSSDSEIEESTRTETSLSQEAAARRRNTCVHIHGDDVVCIVVAMKKEKPDSLSNLHYQPPSNV